MSATTLTPHGLSLRAPIANEEDRAQFQQRMALTSLVLFLLAAGFWLATTTAFAILAPEKVSQMWASRTAQVQLATIACGFVLWMSTRARRLSARALDLADAFLAIALCAGWGLMIGFEQTGGRTELIGLLACSYTLVLRAALIPSSPGRTGLLGTLGLSTLVVVTHSIYGRNAGPGQSAVGAAVYVALWGLLGVVATMTISWVIYGLRIQVRKAMQLGQYVLEEKIGEGGMGVVYRARHALLRRPTAIKLLEGARGNALERFEREVQITARLTHPNTIAVYDYGHTPEGVFYYAMEFLEGTTLEDLVTQHGPQPAPRVVHALLQVCGALQEAHEAGLVHRDIKPANIMLTTRGGIRDTVKVLDFGLVKETVGADSASDLGITKANTILGTPHYMAPECMIAPAEVDARTDLYALGATAYFMLTGTRVFDGATLAEICGKHLYEQPVAPSLLRPGVPAALDAALLACLAKKREDRPQDARLLADLLERAAPAWSQEQARAWWNEYGASSPNGGRKPKTEPTERGRTIAVAAEDRD